jgi:hypothetical protein
MNNSRMLVSPRATEMKSTIVESWKNRERDNSEQRPHLPRDSEISVSRGNVVRTVSFPFAYAARAYVSQTQISASRRLHAKRCAGPLQRL